MTPPLTLCVPVLRRYDLLARLFASLHASTLRPATVAIIDNGGSWAGVAHALTHLPKGVAVALRRPEEPAGLAECWNYFLHHTEDPRVIVNDDLTFAPESLAALVASPGGFVSALAGSNAFSGFLLRDWVVDAVGDFDETISPGYAYFEDNDYAERLAAAGIPITAVDCGVEHAPSQTIATYTEDEMAEHHRRFELARANFVKKWGALPAELAARRGVQV